MPSLHDGPGRAVQSGASACLSILHVGGRHLVAPAHERHQKGESHERHANGVDRVHRVHESRRVPGSGLRVGVSRVIPEEGGQEDAGEGELPRNFPGLSISPRPARLPSGRATSGVIKGPAGVDMIPGNIPSLLEEG